MNIIVQTKYPRKPNVERIQEHYTDPSVSIENALQMIKNLEAGQNGKQEETVKKSKYKSTKETLQFKSIDKSEDKLLLETR